MDFAAISFYPFLKGLSTNSEITEAFDFLHDNVSIPIAFAETRQTRRLSRLPVKPCGAARLPAMALRAGRDSP